MILSGVGSSVCACVCGRSAGVREILVQARVVGFCADLRVRETLVASFLAREENRERHGRAAVMLDERRGARLLDVVFYRDGDEAIGWIDVAIRAAHLELAAVRVSPDVAPRAAGTQVDLAHGHGESGWAGVPVGDVLRVGEYRPDE